MHPYPSFLARHVPVAALILATADGLAAQGAPGRTQDQDTRAAIHGRVLDAETGVAVRSAVVTLWPAPPGLSELARISGLGARATDEGGRFLFRDVSPGSYRLTVSALGYQAMADSVRLLPGADLDLVLTPSPDPIRLEALVVEARPAGPRLPARRDVRPSGSPSFVVTRDDIEERRPRYLTDMLLPMPGARVVSGRGVGNTLLLRGGCRPAVWIDRVRVLGPEGIDQLAPPGDVEAVHVYQGHEVPVEFGTHACGGVVIWTRDGTPSGSETALTPMAPPWRRLAMAVGFVLLAVVISK